MTFAERRDHALTLMAHTDVAPSRYAPPFYRWLWRLGAQIRHRILRGHGPPR